MDLSELLYFLAGIIFKLEEFTHLSEFPVELVRKCILICYDRTVITDQGISVEEIDGKPYFFNERYPGYKRELIEYALAMCLLEPVYLERPLGSSGELTYFGKPVEIIGKIFYNRNKQIIPIGYVRLHPSVRRCVRRGRALFEPTHHAGMHSEEIKELAKKFFPKVVE